MAKNIVVCTDGTWNEPEKTPEDPTSNIIKIARAVRPSAPDGRCQVVFYDAGVGTAGRIDRYTGGAFGIGLSDNIKDAYRFIALNYEEGDHIFCFGFSRGAYTARSLCGMIGAVGLLRQVDMNRLPHAFDYYRTEPAKRNEPAARKLIEGLDARPCPIRFVGVFDTVGSLGVPVTWLRWLSKPWVRFHDETLGKHIENAFQAVAIDETRGPFAPCLWKPATGGPRPGQRVEQVWFAGAHSNVGGGYPQAGLSDIALEWMMERAEACGLAFDDEFRARWIRPDHRGRLTDSRTGVYRVMRRHLRVIRGPGHLAEAIHPTAISRYRETGEGFNRANLDAALRALEGESLRPSRGDGGAASLDAAAE